MDTENTATNPVAVNAELVAIIEALKPYGVILPSSFPDLSLAKNMLETYRGQADKAMYAALQTMTISAWWATFGSIILQARGNEQANTLFIPKSISAGTKPKGKGSRGPKRDPEVIKANVTRIWNAIEAIPKGEKFSSAGFKRNHNLTTNSDEADYLAVVKKMIAAKLLDKEGEQTKRLYWRPIDVTPPVVRPAKTRGSKPEGTN